MCLFCLTQVVSCGTGTRSSLHSPLSSRQTPPSSDPQTESSYVARTRSEPAFFALLGGGLIKDVDPGVERSHYVHKWRCEEVQLHGSCQALERLILAHQHQPDAGSTSESPASQQLDNLSRTVRACVCVCIVSSGGVYQAAEPSSRQTGLKLSSQGVILLLVAVRRGRGRWGGGAASSPNHIS